MTVCENGQAGAPPAEEPRFPEIVFTRGCGRRRRRRVDRAGRGLDRPQAGVDGGPPGSSAGVRFELTDVDDAPDDLYGQIPCQGVLVRRLPGPDRPDYWLARLVTPLRWSDEGTVRTVDHLVLAARLVGQSIDGPFVSLTVGVAFVVDDTLLADASLRFEKVRYVAIGTIRRL